MKNRKSIGKAMTVLIVMLVTIVSLSGTALLVGTAAGFTQCSDNYDNNQNGLIDSQDPACHTDWNANNPNSYDPTINAEQGSGNSGDWYTPPGCVGQYCNPPQPPVTPPCGNGCNPPQVYQCSDNIDNDGDGLVDYPNDPGCSGPTDNNETNGGGGSNLSVRCDVSDTRVEEGDKVTFEVEISGGTAPYDIDWEGDISGNDDEESVRFNRAGSYDVEVEVTDANGNRDSDDCSTVRVEDDDDTRNPPTRTNQPPYFVSSPNTIAYVGQSYFYDANALDPDNDLLVYSLIQAPTGMSINPSTGFISWTPSNSQANQSFPVTVRVQDGYHWVNQNYSVFVQGRVVLPPVVIQPPTVLGVSTVATLDIFDVRMYNDANQNVIVTFQTTIPADGSVYFSPLLCRIGGNTDILSGYNWVRYSQGQTTYHQVNLGRVESNLTYVMRAHAVAGKQTDTTEEMTFMQLADGLQFQGQFVQNQNTQNSGVVQVIEKEDYGSPAFASALAALGVLLLNPWFLLLVIIILLAIILMRRSQTSVSTHGPVEIR